MPTPPRRRWFQFGLGTMFVVVTVFAVWLGLELKFIRERRAFIESRPNSRYPPWIDVPEWPPRPEPTIPFWRRWLGDTTEKHIAILKPPTLDEKRQARRLFPEAKIHTADGVFPPGVQP